MPTYYICDKSGVTVANKVVTELGRRNVYAMRVVSLLCLSLVAELGRRNVCAMLAAEKGKTHTILSCVSVSGFMLPPMMSIFTRSG